MVGDKLLNFEVPNSLKDSAEIHEPENTTSLGNIVHYDKPPKGQTWPLSMEFYAAERKKELIPFATAWMELESIMLSEISQAVRDKYHLTFISPLSGT